MDALAAQSADGSLLISVVNKKSKTAVDLDVTIKDSLLTGQVQIEALSADQPWAKNTLENPKAITPIKTKLRIQNGKLTITLKPYTILQIRIPSQLNDR